MSFRLSLIAAQFVHWSISLLYNCWLKYEKMYLLSCFIVLVCVWCIRVWVGVCVGGKGECRICIWRPEVSIHVLYYFLPFFFALLLEISYMCTVNYIYCFPFHSLLIVTKCPLCNFMGLSLLSFYFASPLSPVGAVHVYRGEEPFPGRWESTNGQSNKEDSLSLAANPCPQLLAGGGGGAGKHLIHPV